jgi:hypothetical protein
LKAKELRLETNLVQQGGRIGISISRLKKSIYILSYLGTRFASPLLAATIFLFTIVFPSSAFSNEVLSYFSTLKNGGVDWVLYDPKTRTKTSRGRFAKAPNTLFWDRDGQTVFYLYHGYLWRAPFYETTHAPFKLGPAPDLDTEEVAHILWREKDVGRFRFISSRSLDESQVTRVGGKTTLHVPGEPPIPANLEVEWGSHSVYKVHQFDSALKKWRVLHRLGSKTHAHDVPGISVALPYWHEDGFSDAKLEVSFRCYANYASDFTRPCWRPKASRAILLAFLGTHYQNFGPRPKCVLNKRNLIVERRGCRISGFGTIFCAGCRFGLLHGTIHEGAPLAMLPAQLFNVETGESGLDLLPRKGQNQQTYIAAKGPYAAVLTYNSVGPGHIIIVDMNTGKIILDTLGFGAVWAPG